jgi:hypothetical protein
MRNYFLKNLIFLLNCGGKLTHTVLEFFNILWGLRTEQERVVIRPARARIFKRLWSPGIDTKERIPPAYVA